MTTIVKDGLYIGGPLSGLPFIRPAETLARLPIDQRDAYLNGQPRAQPAAVIEMSDDDWSDLRDQLLGIGAYAPAEFTIPDDALAPPIDVMPTPEPLRMAGWTALVFGIAGAIVLLAWAVEALNL